MSVPKLADWQLPLDPPATPEERLWLARQFDTPPHRPRRTCLGCGHTAVRLESWRFWYVQCWGWGVEANASVERGEDEPYRAMVLRLSWAEVDRLLSQGVQAELFAEVPA